MDNPNDVVITSENGVNDGDMTDGKLVINIGRTRLEGGFDPGEPEVPGQWKIYDPEIDEL